MLRARVQITLCPLQLSSSTGFECDDEGEAASKEGRRWLVVEGFAVGLAKLRRDSRRGERGLAFAGAGWRERSWYSPAIGRREESCILSVRSGTKE